MKIINEQLVKDKRVLLRLDLDVPLEEDGSIADTTRIDVAQQTFDLLQNAKQVTFIGHMGRPGGRVDESLSLKKLLPYLEEKIGQTITFSDDFVPSDAKITLLENLRFFAGEEKNDPTFANALARVGDIYVNEAFGVSHRTAASTVGVARLLPAYAGLHLAKEVVELSTILHNPIRPFILVLGGAKLETKLPVIAQLQDNAEAILVGGLLAKQIHEEKPQLPANVVVAQMRADGQDIAPESIERFSTILSKAQTIVWNGPVGKFEEENASDGTKKIAAAIIASDAYTVVGGGDTLAAIKQFKIEDQFDFVSVGGGAMLEFLSGQPLPALQVLG